MLNDPNLAPKGEMCIIAREPEFASKRTVIDTWQ